MTTLGYVHQYLPGTRADGLTVLALHGTGGDEHDLVPLVQAVAPGAAILAPRGDVSEQGALRFFRRLAEGVFDLDDLARRTAALGAFVEGAAAQYGLARERVVALGFSNGANIAASLLLARPGLLAGAVLVRAMVPFEPSAPTGRADVPVLLREGRMDPLVPAANAERLATLLAATGAEVTLQWAHAGHGLVQGDVDAAREWLAERFPAAGA